MIEDKASGTQLIQDLIGDGLSHVARYSPDGDKIMRLHAQSAVIENGFVFVPDEAPWLADYLSELTDLPGRPPRRPGRTRPRRRSPGRGAPLTGAEGWIEFWAGRGDGLRRRRRG